MKWLDLTLPTPEENLACDEALLDLCERGALPDGLLRFWEPKEHFVVVGYANSVAGEVNVAFCEGAGIPILRRCSGGGTVLQGPGCLNYSLVLPMDHPVLGNIPATNAFILDRHKAALTLALRTAVERRGQTDLAIGGLKFSGNAQRRKKRSLLFHGTFLLDLYLRLIEQTLLMPSRQPDYRQNRSHSQFLLNLNQPADLLRTALRNAWAATAPFDSLPFEEISRLVREKYGSNRWNRRI